MEDLKLYEVMLCIDGDVNFTHGLVAAKNRKEAINIFSVDFEKVFNKKVDKSCKTNDWSLDKYKVLYAKQIKKTINNIKIKI